jgi:Domain of unknown function (DUF4145)
MPYVHPQFKLNLFNCPLCNGYSEQSWYSASKILGTPGGPMHDNRLDKVYFCICKLCNKYTVWVDEKLIHPPINGASLPHQDMPQQVKDIYEEARGVMSRSPRSACTLLRVALEILIDGILGKNKNTLNHKIGVLVKERGLDVRIQKAMDILRITGDAALHPGVIDLQNKDDSQTAKTMFDLLNIITQVMISNPNTINEYYNNLPQPQKNSIEKRDVNNSSH